MTERELIELLTTRLDAEIAQHNALKIKHNRMRQMIIDLEELARPWAK